MSIRWPFLSFRWLSLLAALAAVPGHAQTYPSKPIHMIVPFAAGGASDTSARIVAQKLSDRMSQQVVVENRTGAGGTIGASVVAKANPDGYTVLMGSSSELVISPHLYKTAPYESVRDFASISMVASQPLILSVHPSVPAKSVRELIALAKSKPGALNAASSGNGSSLHLAQVLFENAAQVKFTHVPFAGSPQAAIGTVSGETQVTFGTVPAVQEHVKSGRLRGLAVTSLKRRAAMADLPTVHEAGVPDYEMLIWNALVAPRGTPVAVITRLNAEVVKILEMPDVREAFSRLGGEAWPSTPEELRAYMAADWAKMQKVVAQSGAKID